MDDERRSVALVTRSAPRDFVPPRIGTPREEGCATLGAQIADMAERLGEPFMPHQRHIADVAYELNDDGRLKYDEIVLSMMRQSGKTSFVRAKSIWRVSVGQQMFEQDQVSVYLAQKRQDARKKLARDFVPRLRHSTARGDFREIRDSRDAPKLPGEWKLSMNNGQEQIMFGPSSYLQIETPNREAGHGDTVDDATIDEAFAHRSDEIEVYGRSAVDARRSPVGPATTWSSATYRDPPKIQCGSTMSYASRPLGLLEGLVTVAHEATPVGRDTAIEVIGLDRPAGDSWGSG